MKPMKQNGGTLLGFIIGLVLGLAIAVVVAMMITKTSTPFTNKLGLTKNGDAPTIQLTDPNKPLYGASVKELMAQKAAEPAKPAAAVSTPAAVNTPTPAAENKPAAKAPEAAKTEVDDKFAYYLQVGAYREETDAEGARARLALVGVESHVSPKTADGDNLFRVRVGPFDRMDNMNRMRSKLTENGIDVAVIKTPK